ncbi:MAG: T9SS C-terminal target domain-containing protein, partial [Psychroflexus sp.]
MRNSLYLTMILFVGIIYTNSYSQTIESDCNCDVVITDKNDSFPYDNYQESRNKTVCFQGDFDYEMNWDKLGNNITLCVGEEVSFKSNGLNFEGSKSIYNYGTFEFGQSLVLDENSSIFNYGEMESIFTFNGGSLQNLNNSELVVIGYSNFNSGNVFNDYTSIIEIKQNEYTNIGENMTFNSQGEVVFNGNVDNKGELTLAGISEFKKKLINNNLANLSGELKFEEGYNSNSNDAVTIANGFLEIDGDVNLWNGHLEANSGLIFKEKTQINNGASLEFMGVAEFENLTTWGEIYTNFSCNELKIKKGSGNGRISTNSNSSIYVKKLKDLPDNLILSGDITENKCVNDTDIIVWLGTESSDAGNEKNWSDKLKNKSSILIPKTRNNPVISEKFEASNILIKEGVELSNKNLIKLKGNLRVEGKLNSKEGIIEFNGKQVQTINLNSKAEVGSLIIDNSDNVELKNGSIDVYKNIELLNGNLITNHSGTTPEENLITFKSDSTRTAILKEVV